MQAASPQEAAALIADKRAAMGDPELRALYLGYDAAFDWSPDDPRLDALAGRTQRWIARRHGRVEGRGPSIPDPAIAHLAASAGASSPAWDRLTQLARERHPEAR